MKTFVTLGSISTLSGVALGAFGAQGLKTKVTPEMLATWNTGVDYHLVHALGLILIGILCHIIPDVPLIRTAGWFIVAGTLLFSCSLYILVLSGIQAFGMITPLGGIAFMLGWLLLAIAAWKNASQSKVAEGKVDGC